MARLVWDQVGGRRFQTGIDRGVLYLQDGTIVPWSGLTSVEEVSNRRVQPYYQDGVKYMSNQILGNAELNIKAFTYPDQFNRCMGVAARGDGIFWHDQLAESFNLSYRTLLGNDLEGLEHGYIIHVLYNLIATPSSHTHSSVGGSITPMEFSWNVSSVPPVNGVIRPTSHFSVLSTAVDPAALASIENALYGTDTDAPYLLPVDAFV
jgi:hypothetical protein